jgi:urease alpha subunit
MKYNLLALLLFANIVSAQTPPAARERTLVLTHIAVIDATGSQVKAGMSVIIRNHKIVMIGGTAKLSMPDDAEIVDGTDKFLIPGLWDTHVHTGAQETYLPLYIANGITGCAIWAATSTKPQENCPHAMFNFDCGVNKSREAGCLDLES